MIWVWLSYHSRLSLLAFYLGVLQRCEATRLGQFSLPWHSSNWSIWQLLSFGALKPQIGYNYCQKIAQLLFFMPLTLLEPKTYIPVTTGWDIIFCSCSKKSLSDLLPYSKHIFIRNIVQVNCCCKKISAKLPHHQRQWWSVHFKFYSVKTTWLRHLRRQHSESVTTNQLTDNFAYTLTEGNTAVRHKTKRRQG